MNIQFCAAATDIGAGTVTLLTTGLSGVRRQSLNATNRAMNSKAEKLWGSFMV
jgi:hypothetical protein